MTDLSLNHVRVKDSGYNGYFDIILGNGESVQIHLQDAIDLHTILGRMIVDNAASAV